MIYYNKMIFYQKNETIVNNFVKAYAIINRPQYKTIFCFISGGSDSDIMLDIVFKADVNKKVTYVWFDTGLEFAATKSHITYLEKNIISIYSRSEPLNLFQCVLKNMDSLLYPKMFRSF